MTKFMASRASRLFVQENIGPDTLTRARSVLQRARSIRLSSFTENCATLESRGYCIL